MTSFNDSELANLSHDIKILSYRPEDTIVVQLRGWVSKDDVDRATVTIREAIKDPNAKILVTDINTKIGILRPEDTL